MTTDHARAARALFDEGEVRDVLRETFYRSDVPLRPLATVEPEADAPVSRVKAPRKRASKPKPDHYEILCISMYVEDLGRLDEKVASLKTSGHRRMTRSALIRYALDQLDLEKVPRPI